MGAGPTEAGHLVSANYPPIPEELRPRIEAMVQDECPLSEIARTFGLNASSLTAAYPEARMPAQMRGQMAAFTKALNALPNTLTRRNP